MNVNTKFSSAQFPTYTPTSQSTVIKPRRTSAPEPNTVGPKERLAEGESMKPPAAEESQQDVISDDEKQFFVNLFPGAASEIKTYSPYGRNGMKQSAVVGSLVDLKG
jgi:hypothetical protein